MTIQFRAFVRPDDETMPVFAGQLPLGRVPASLPVAAQILPVRHAGQLRHLLPECRGHRPAPQLQHGSLRPAVADAIREGSAAQCHALPDGCLRTQATAENLALRRSQNLSCLPSLIRSVPGLGAHAPRRAQPKPNRGRPVAGRRRQEIAPGQNLRSGFSATEALWQSNVPNRSIPSQHYG